MGYTGRGRYAVMGSPLVIDWHSDAGANFTMTNATQAERLAGNTPRHIRFVPATNYTQVRLHGYVITASASANTPQCRLAYKTGAFSATVGDYTVITGAVFSVASAAYVDTGWITLPAAARADIFVALTEIGGDGVADPALGNLAIMFK